MKNFRLTALLTICLCIILLFCSCFEQTIGYEVLDDKSDPSPGASVSDPPRAAEPVKPIKTRLEPVKPIETRLMINHYGQWYEVGYDENDDLQYIVGELFKLNTYSWVTGSKDSPEEVQALAAAQLEDANHLPFSLFNYYGTYSNPTGRADIFRDKAFWATFNGNPVPDCLSVFKMETKQSVFSPAYFSFPDEDNAVNLRMEAGGLCADFYESEDYNDQLFYESDYFLQFFKKVNYDGGSNPEYYPQEYSFQESLYYDGDQDLYRYEFYSEGEDEYNKVTTGWDPDRRLAWKREINTTEPDIIFERAYNEKGLVSGVAVYTYIPYYTQKKGLRPFDVNRLIRFQYDEQDLLSMVSEIKFSHDYTDTFEDFSDVEALLLCDPNTYSSETGLYSRYDYYISRDSRGAVEKISVESELFGERHGVLGESIYRPVSLKDGESSVIPGIGTIDFLGASFGEYYKDPEHPERENIHTLGKTCYSLALRFTNTGNNVITPEQLSAGPKCIHSGTHYIGGELYFFGREDPVLPGESRTFIVGFAIDGPVTESLPVYAVLMDSFLVVSHPHLEYDEDLFY